MRHDYRLFKRKGSNVWYFYYYDGDTRSFRSTGQVRKYEAEKVAAKFLSRGARPDQTLNEYTSTFFIAGQCEWIKRQHAKGRPFSASMAAMRRAHLDNYICKRFGQYRLEDLNPVQIENWLVALPLANQTKRHILYTLRIVLREAEREGVIARSPAEQVEPVARNHKPRDVFTKAELQQLFPADDARLFEIWGSLKYAAAFLILASTGIRSGELRALRWSALLQDANVLVVENGVKSDGTIGPTKTGKVRVVPLTGRAAALLSAWRSNAPDLEPEAPIFPGRSGKGVMDRVTLPSRLTAALSRAEIATNGRNVVVHSFRHTFNTLMRPVLPLTVLQGITGHSTDAMTNHYDHPTISVMVKDLGKQRESLAGAITDRLFPTDDTPQHDISRD